MNSRIRVDKEVPPWNRYVDGEEVSSLPIEERLTKKEKHVKELMDRAWEALK